MLFNPSLRIAKPLIGDHDSYSFETKKVAFVSGPSATEIKDKDDFFNILIYDYLSIGLDPNIEYRVFDENQKQASGGYDVLVMQTPKILTDKQLEMNIQKLGELGSEK